MAYYTGKDTTDAFIDPEYERLRRDRNLLKLELERLNKLNTKLNLEIAQNKVKLVTFERLVTEIDRQYEEYQDDFIKYLHYVAHHFDEPEEELDEYSDEITDILQKCDEYDSI